MYGGKGVGVGGGWHVEGISRTLPCRFQVWVVLGDLGSLADSVDFGGRGSEHGEFKWVWVTKIFWLFFGGFWVVFGWFSFLRIWMVGG